MQTQKEKDSKQENHKNSNSSKSISTNNPKPKKLKRRFNQAFKSKVKNKEYVYGNSVVLVSTTLAILFIYSVVPMVSIAGALLFGSVLGSVKGSLINKKKNLFNDEFDLFTSSLFQISLVWMTIGFISIFGSISMLPLLISGLFATVMLPIMSTKIGKSF